MRLTKLLALSFVCLCCCVLTGCSMSCDVLEFMNPAGPPDSNEMSLGYKEMVLNQSSSSDVLGMINLPEYELLSQNKNVVASYGIKKRDNMSWFKMAAFDENSIVLKRKYWFVQDERPKKLFVEPWEGLWFNCKLTADADVLAEPYANENARRIALLKWVRETFNADMREVGTDNKDLAVCGMLVNQALETVLVELNESAAKAAYLSNPAGLKFEHISYDKGRIQMILADGVVSVKLRLGMPVKKLKACEDIETY